MNQGMNEGASVGEEGVKTASQISAERRRINEPPGLLYALRLGPQSEGGQGTCVIDSIFLIK